MHLLALSTIEEKRNEMTTPLLFEPAFRLKGTVTGSEKNAGLFERNSRRTRCELLMLAVLASTASAGCGGGNTISSALVTDSAGITIITNTDAMWTAANAWRLSDAPTVDIGVVEGEEPYQLFRVRGAVRLTDGRIVVANGGTNELRFFDSTGVYLSRSGGEGGGPGEFAALRTIWRFDNDSILAYDFSQKRFSVFDSAGRYVRTTRIGPDTFFFFPNIAGRLADGSYVASFTNRQIAPGMPGRDQGLGLTRDSLYLFRFGQDGMEVDTLGLFPGTIRDVRKVTVLGRSQNIPILQTFSPTTTFAVSGNRVLVGTSDTYEIKIIDRDGFTQQIIRREYALVPTTDEHVETFAEQMRQALAGSETGVNTQLASLITATIEGTPHPTLPAYTALMVDREGNLWVTRHRVDPDAPPRWDVFDTSGRFLGTVDGPARFNPTDIGSDYILGVWEDELEVNHVLLYALIHP